MEQKWLSGRHSFCYLALCEKKFSDPCLPDKRRQGTRCEFKLLIETYGNSRQLSDLIGFCIDRIVSATMPFDWQK